MYIFLSLAIVSCKSLVKLVLFCAAWSKKRPEALLRRIESNGWQRTKNEGVEGEGSRRTGKHWRRWRLTKRCMIQPYQVLEEGVFLRNQIRPPILSGPKYRVKLLTHPSQSISNRSIWHLRATLSGGRSMTKVSLLKTIVCVRLKWIFIQVI